MLRGNERIATAKKCKHRNKAFKDGANGDLYEVCEECGQTLRLVEQCDVCDAPMDPKADTCAQCG